jgi:sugar lactone lactonase YvrE
MSSVNLESKELKIMVAIILLLIISGSIFIFKKSESSKGRVSNRNEKRYDAGQLHYVDESIILYEQKKSFKSHFNSALGLALDDANNLYICGNDGIRSFNKQFEFEEHFYYSESIRCIAISKKGQIIAASESTLIYFDNKGKVIKKLSKKEWGLLNSIVITKDFMFLADRMHRKIWKCNHDGEIIKSFGSIEEDKINGLIIPGIHMDMALSSKGLLYVSNPGRHHVNSYTLDGNLVSVFGRPSFKHEGFCGCCNPVSIAIMNNGSLMTCEKGISRVKSLDLKGKLLGVVAAPIDFKNNKHAYTIDLLQGKNNLVYLLESGTNQVYIYQKINGKSK